MQCTVNIKPVNLNKIIALANGDSDNCVQGSQLEALYRLIQSKGDTIRCDDPTDKLHGLKCVKLLNNQYLAMAHFPLKSENFYPCMTRTYLLTEDDIN